MLPQNTALGELEIFEVYEYLDGPRLFAATNNVGTMYLVFWFDETDDATGWLYLPISEAKLSKLRRKQMSLQDAYRTPETNYFKVYTAIPPQADTADPVMRSDIDEEFFPPQGHYIEYVDVINQRYDWLFEANLKGRRPSAEVVAQFIGRFRELAEGIMTTISNQPSQLYPQSALAGSLKIKFGTSNDSAAVESLTVIAQLISTNSEEEFREQFRAHRINPSQLKDFLNLISRNSLDIELIPKTASDGDITDFPIERVRQCIEYLGKVERIVVDSIKIPQANDIDKVLKVVRMMDDGTPLTPQSIGELTAQRQVQYYTDAAYALGLSTKDLQPTAAGKFVISHSSKESQYQILADRFESTDFGWAWLQWAGVEYMTELDPETAEDFIRQSVPTLSGDTPRRRASTLRKWLTKLKPYHRKFEQDKS